MCARNLSQSDSDRTAKILLVLAGVLFLGLAWVSTPTRIEQLLLGQHSGDLDWGPALFRALLAFHGVALIAIAFIGFQRSETLTKRTHGPQVSRVEWMILALICVFALALRLWRLEGDLWYDEVHTLLEYVRPPIKEILTDFSSQNQHMLYSVVAHLSLSTLGESTAALRLPAALFGVASIWALFRLGTLTNGVRESILASALMTISYHHIWFSQNARGYTGLLFFTLVSTELWLRASRESRASLWTGYLVAVSLGIWVHMTMIFVVASHGICYLADLLTARNAPRGMGRPRYRWWTPLVAWMFGASLTLQLYALSLPEFIKTALHEEALDSSEWTDPLWFVREAADRLADIGVLGIVPLVGLVILLVGWLSLWQRDWRATVVMTLPGLLGGATMIALGHPLWPRFFFFCMGFLLLMLVRGCMRSPELLLSPGSASTTDRRRRASTTIGLAAVILLLLASTVATPRAYLPKQNFTGARDFVLHNLSDQDATVAVGLAGEMYQIYYAPSWTVVNDRTNLEQIENRHDNVWLIYTLPVHLQAWHPDLWETIQSSYEVVRVFAGTLGGGDVVVCRNRQGV